MRHLGGCMHKTGSVKKPVHHLYGPVYKKTQIFFISRGARAPGWAPKCEGENRLFKSMKHETQTSTKYEDKGRLKTMKNHDTFTFYLSPSVARLSLFDLDNKSP